jgi:beta-glucanase (GH16 family)
MIKKHIMPFKFLIKLLFLTHLPIITLSQCVEQRFDFSKPIKNQDFSVDYNIQNVEVRNNSLILKLTQQLGGTRISLNQEMQYGHIDVTMRMSPGSNVVSSFILMAENGDEIDFEFVGKDGNLIQTNYFYKGVLIYDKNAKFYKVPKNLSTSFEKYTIHWSPDYYEWKYNGYTLRQLFRNQTKNFPDSRSKVQFGIWQAQPSNWAGPGILWNQEPFNVTITNITISCHSQNMTIPHNLTDVVSPIPGQNATQRNVTIANVNLTNFFIPRGNTTQNSTSDPQPTIPAKSSDARQITNALTVYWTLLIMLFVRVMYVEIE